MITMCVIVEFIDHNAFETNKPLLQTIPKDEVYLRKGENAESFE